MTKMRMEFESWMINTAKIVIGSPDPYPAGLERDYWRVWQAATLSQPVQPSQVINPFSEQVESVAMKLAECFDYSWDYMPEPGRNNIRDHAKSVIAAINTMESVQPKEVKEITDEYRLNFLIANNAYVTSDTDCNDGFWINYIKANRSILVQIGNYKTPRDAIDAAILEPKETE